MEPTASGGRVATIAIDSAKGRVYVGGQFTSINAVANTHRFAVVNVSDGALTSGVQQGMRVNNTLYTVDSRAQTQTYYYYRYAPRPLPLRHRGLPGYVAWAATWPSRSCPTPV
ncbi:MAG: hypothetical protein R2706_09355 [Acidimicrobiales bacterium]